MLNRHAAEITVTVEIQQRVLVEVFGLSNLGRAKLYVQRIGILKIFDFHGAKDLSKNTLWTVSPSGNSITRRYFSVHLLDWCPATNSPIPLNDLLDWVFHDPPNPFQLDHGSIWPQAHLLKVLCKLHGGSFTRSPGDISLPFAVHPIGNSFIRVHPRPDFFLSIHNPRSPDTRHLT